MGVMQRTNGEWMGLIKSLAKYCRPDIRQTLWQLANSFIPFFIMWYLMLRSLEISYLLTLALAVPTAGFMARIFIIFHDCGHGSFFDSKRANDIWGFITGVITLTPYHQWRHSHAMHHASAGDLGRRGTGDIWTLTVKEYIESSKRQQLVYRIYRSPIALFIFGPILIFVVSYRFSAKESSRRDRESVYLTNLMLLGIVLLALLTIGLKAFILVELPIIWFGFSVGIWMFYIQHQFEGVYWERHEDWEYYRAAVEGSSFYKLPKILQWFTGNIGFHHVHHLQPRIPNYKLEKCHNEQQAFQAVKPITLSSGWRSLSLRLWDEEQRQLVGFSQLGL
jgi:omega-6 fatty acid desaturase (delta-12 desaturase)